jgi:hypothetical protein
MKTKITLILAALTLQMYSAFSQDNATAYDQAQNTLNGAIKTIEDGMTALKSNNADAMNDALMSYSKAIKTDGKDAKVPEGTFNTLKRTFPNQSDLDLFLYTEIFKLQTSPSSDLLTAQDHFTAAIATINKGLDALKKVKSEKNINTELERLLNEQRHKELNAEASLKAMKIKPSQLSPEELTFCIQMFRLKSRYPGTVVVSEQECGGDKICYNPAGPGYICCSNSEDCASSCGPEGQNCHATCEACFPIYATVTLKNGEKKTMDAIEIGDQVQVIDEYGVLAYEDIYMITHQEAEVAAWYVDLTLASGAALSLSPRHFIPTTADGANNWEKRVLKGANEIKLGDLIWYLDSKGELASSTVATINKKVEKGVYNPMTMNGIIVVDGVVASAHSDWFLDGIVSADAQGGIYQSMFGPIRGIYGVIGVTTMKKITQEWGVVDFVREQTNMLIALTLLLLLLGLFGGILRVKKARQTAMA